MLKQKQDSIRFFKVDQRGINDLKNEFYDEAREFVYYRKGEWHGILESIRYAAEWAKQNPQWVAIAVACYQPTKDLVKAIAKATGVGVASIKRYFGQKKKHVIDRRVICSSGVFKKDIEKWEAICGTGSVVTSPESQVGKFRYIVNERRYAIFTRFGPNDLQGIIGTDRGTIVTLRDMFNREFITMDLKGKQFRQKQLKKSRHPKK